MQLGCSSATCWKAIEVASNHNSPLSITVVPPKSPAIENQIDLVSYASSLALDVRRLATEYKVPVILHSQHCYKLLYWLDGLLVADKAYYKEHKEPLFSSHGIDLTHDPHWDETLSICRKYFADSFVRIDLWLEMTVESTLATRPRLVAEAHACFSRFGKFFSIGMSSPKNGTTLLEMPPGVQKEMHQTTPLFVVSRSVNAVKVFQFENIDEVNHPKDVSTN